MADRAITLCDQCGPPGDDHPKVHIGTAAGGVVTKHHDCLSYAEKQTLIEGPQGEEQVAASAIIAKCESGTKGLKLLEFIQAEQAKTDKRLSRES